MGKVIAVCGKICSGKTWYGRQWLRRHPGVLLSCDDCMLALYRPELGDAFDDAAKRAKAYLHDRAAEIAAAGCDVLLDWGFWTREERQKVAAFYRAKGIKLEWHYVEIGDDAWRRNIQDRNVKVRSGVIQAYYVDEGLMKKCMARFEPPESSEIQRRIPWETLTQPEQILP